MPQNLNPQGYNYGIDPENKNPFWDGGESEIISIAATATVDNSTGTPSVAVANVGTRLSPIFKFDFHNIKGAQGERGLQGEQGERGLQGIQGIQGERGAQGIQGERGIQGIQGERGIQGIQGETGATGATPVISADATVNGNVGTPSVSVSKTGTNEAPVLHFAFSNLKGATGATGATGAAGQDGQDGQDGADGADGLDGAYWWFTTDDYTTPNYTFSISDLVGVTGRTPNAGDLILQNVNHRAYVFQIDTVNTTTVLCDYLMELSGATYSAGTGVEISNGTISVKVASDSQLGGVKVDGSTITIDENGVISSSGGGGGSYTAGTGIDITNDEISVKTASTSQLGGVKVDGSTITIDANGVISASGGTTYTAGTGIDITNDEISLKKASTSQLGGVKVDGTTITADANGVISAAGGGGSTPSYAVGTAEKTGEITISGVTYNIKRLFVAIGGYVQQDDGSWQTVVDGGGSGINFSSYNIKTILDFKLIRFSNQSEEVSYDVYNYHTYNTVPCQARYGRAGSSDASVVGKIQYFYPKGKKNFTPEYASIEYIEDV